MDLYWISYKSSLSFLTLGFDRQHRLETEPEDERIETIHLSIIVIIYF